MGIIDPMAISNAATIGGMEFGVGPVLWFLTIALLCSAAAAIALAGLRLGSIARLSLPKLGHAQLAAMGISRSR